MSSDSSTWFVKASFGAEWGPMSAETLLHMAGEGAFASDDVARCGIAGSWQPIAAVLDVIRSGATATFVVNEPASVEAGVADDSDEPAARRVSLPGWTNYWNTAAKSEPPDTEEPATIESGTATEQSDGQFADLNTWRRERQERLDRLLKTVAEQAAETARPLAAESESKSANSEQAVVTEPTSTPEASPQPIETLFVESARSARRRDEKWEETLARWKRAVPDWRMVLPALLLGWLVWNYWPVPQSRIAETYRSMYAELRHLRDLPLNKTGMAEFVARSETTLGEVLPRLSGRANNDPNAQLLLRMGRDCLQPILKNPNQRGTAQEEQFKQLLAEWDAAHHITPKAESLPQAHKTP